MTREEQLLKLNLGAELILIFGLRKQSYILGGVRITKKQFDWIIDNYKDRLRCRYDFTGLTKHIYKLE